MYSLAIFLLPLACRLVNAQGTSDIKAQNPADNATAFALIYGYPLILYVQTFEPTIRAVGTNTFQHENHTATATSEVLVRPNVDTLYSRVAIDLSCSDVVVTVPEVPADRFYVVPFYDLHGDNFANLGFVGQSQPGDYLLTFVGEDKEPGFQPDNSKKSKYKGTIRYPTAYGSIMARIVVKNNGADLDEVHNLQAQFKTRTIPRQKVAAPLTTELLGNGALSVAALLLPYELSVSQVTQTLQLLATVTDSNPPEQKDDIKIVTGALENAGIAAGAYTPPAGLNYTLIFAQIIASITALRETPTNHLFSQNGWSLLLPSLSGDFHNEYVARTFIAWFGYLQLKQDQALYPTYQDPSSTLGAMSLRANESYILTFSRKPPVKGFWSLTAYNSTNYLIPNGLDRYSLGDRSNLTYWDGVMVYGDEGEGRDGEFEILIQRADREPTGRNGNWTGNWLPAPAGGGEMTVNLRWYGPTAELSDGGYVYPIVRKQGLVV